MISNVFEVFPRQAHLTQLLISSQDALKECLSDSHVLHESSITDLHPTLDQVEVSENLQVQDLL